MLRRPKVGETEQDLLALQEHFLASGEKSAVSLSGELEGVGSKRKQRPERDVVQLGGLPPVVGAGISTTKRSKFKERKLEHNATPLDDPHKAMDEQDVCITELLSDIRHHDVIDSPFSMPTRITKHGFPTVHELDWKNIAKDPSHPHTCPVTLSQHHKKKSLFARHYDSHPPEHFGFEFKPTNQVTPIERDKVQAFNLHPVQALEVLPPPSLQVQHKTTPTSSERVQFASAASQAWADLLTSPPRPSLVSGEGLVRTGVSVDTAREEVEKIHSENVERLAAATEEELLLEKERVEQVLGAHLVAFLKRKTEQKMEGPGALVEGGGGEVEMEMERGESGDGVTEGGGEEVEMERGESGDGVIKGSGGEMKMESDSVEREATGTVVPPGWLHMDEVEKEKMEWMVDVLPETKEGGPVRFSLDGLVIPRGTSLPSHLALHHHGEEPAAAGYTLPELLDLVRSALPRQRVLSLSTLAKIMNKAWCGGYRNIVSHSVLSALCAAGLPLLLRYAVDDSSTAVISAALASLHGLLVPQWEELLLQELCDCHLGTSLPCTGISWVRPQGQAREAGAGRERAGDKKGAKEDSEGEEEEDAEVMDKDVVQGYLVTGLLCRLRYILEVVRPGTAEVTLALEVLTRIARHSLQAATEVVHCLRLMDTVFREFLPLVWDLQKGAEDTRAAYGTPHPAAVRLVQVVCSASRNLTSILLSRHKLLEVIVRYTIPHPSELSLPPRHAHSLSTTALQTGRELLQYGLATEWLRDCYPVLVQQFCSLPSLSLSSLPLHEATHLAALIWLLEPAVCLPPSALPPSLTSSLLTPLLSALPGWVGEGEGGGGEEVLERLVCVRAVLNVLASHLSRQTSTVSHPLDVAGAAAALSSPSGLLVTLTGSSLLSTVLQGLQETSPLCRRSDPLPSPPPPSLPPPSLPFLHSTLPPTRPAMYGDTSDIDYYGFLKPHLVYMSSADFLLGFLRLCLAVSSAHRSSVSRVSMVLGDQRFKQYVLSVCNAPPVKYSCVTFGEFQLLYTAVRLFMMKVAGGGVSDADRLLYHRLSLHLLSIFPPGMECAVDDLISCVVFHPSMFPELGSLPESLLEQDLSSLSMFHPPQPLSSDVSAGPAPPSSVLATTPDRLPSITSSLLSTIRRSVYTQQRLDNSRLLFLSQPSSLPPSQPSLSSLPSLPSLRLPVYSSPLLPVDWFLLPLVSLYQHSLANVSCAPGSEVIVAVKDSLHVQLLLEQLRPHSLAHLPPSTRLARTLTTFLIGNDLFLEGEVRPYLSALLTVYSSQSIQQAIDLTLPIPGLASFHEFYQSLLTQFAAVSYGDALFSCYMMLPLQRRFPVSLRCIVWDQHSHTLRLLSLPLDQLPVKLDSFLLPLETDNQLLDLYMGALATGSVRPQWSPVFYLTAIHHTHHFLFPDTQTAPSLTPFQKKLLFAVQHMKREDTQTHILYYAGPTLDSKLGFKMNAELTETQKTILQLCHQYIN